VPFRKRYLVPFLAFQLAACGGRSVERPQAGFVGRGACVECHAPEVAAWETSDHARAMAEATPATVLGDFGGAAITAGGVTTTFTRRAGGFFVRTDGPDGALREFRVSHVFGADPLQQYLVPFSDGRVQALPIAWDTRPRESGGGRWYHLYEGETVAHDDPLHWTRPLQNWNHMCADCHSTGVRKNYDAEAGRFETSWSEIDVSCEACHGRASAHLEWARGSEREQARDASRGFRTPLPPPLPPSTWRVVDGRLESPDRPPAGPSPVVETCGRCHARATRVSNEPAPGARLADTHRVALLDEALYFADGRIRDEVYEYGSFVQSRMHRAGVTCAHCHEPHAARLRLEGNLVCTQCHPASTYDARGHLLHEIGSSGARCVDCHMPERTYMGVDRRRDHAFRVPRPGLSARVGSPGACVACHEKEGAAWAEEAVAARTPRRAARPADDWPLAIAAGRAWAADAERLLARSIGDPDVPPIARATALELLARSAGALALRPIAAGSEDADPLVRRAAAGALDVLAPEDRLRIGARLLRDEARTVRLEAVASLASPEVERLDESARRAFSAALAEFRESAAADADRAESHLGLGAALARLGAAAAARAAFERAAALDASFVPALVNLADLHRAEGREDLCLATLKRAAEIEPQSALVRQAIALALVRAGRLADAIAELESAERLAPANPEIAYLHALALADAGVGSRDEGLRRLEAAHARFPGFRAILEALAAFARERGDAAAAASWEKRLRALDAPR